MLCVLEDLQRVERHTAQSGAEYAVIVLCMNVAGRSTERMFTVLALERL